MQELVYTLAKRKSLDALRRKRQMLGFYQRYCNSISDPRKELKLPSLC